jgi:phage portal protein BeeE
MSVDEYAQLLQGYGNRTFPLGVQGRGLGQAKEDPDEEFETYIYQAYKSNGIVFACMLTRQLIFTEARFQYQRMRKGRPGDLWGDDSLSVLERPWPNGTTGDLLARAIQDVDLAGNHYVVREEDGRLRRLRPDWVTIVLTAPPDSAVHSDIAGYVYMPGGVGTDPGNWEIYPIDGSNGPVAHWCPIPDPDAQYKGMSWLTPVMREIFADKQATSHKAQFFAQGATPNLAISFKESVTTEQFKEFMETMSAQGGGVENAYQTLYLGGGADVKAVGADMKMLDFRNVIGAGEVRIAAAARVHPVIIGLPDALTGSSLNQGNYKAAKRQFGDGTIRPLWRSISAAYEVLLPKHNDSRLWYDDRDIDFLRDDAADRAEILRTQSATMSAWIMSGFTPESIITTILEEDISRLEHTGNLSVQLLPGSSSAMSAQSVVMKTLADAGYSLESITAAVESNDISKLVKAPIPIQPPPAAPAKPPSAAAPPKKAATPSAMPKKKPTRSIEEEE